MKKKEELFSALGSIDEKLIMEAAPDQKENLKNNWIRWVAAAACLALLIGALHVGISLYMTPPVANNRISIPANMDELLYAGDPGSIVDEISSGALSAPPPQSTNIVTAKVASILPGRYQSLGSHSDDCFRILEMETVADLGDVEMPQKFYLQVWEKQYTDFSQYDHILFDGLYQCSYEGSVAYNATTGNAEAFDLPIFNAIYYSCFYVYAFTDGVLDTAMWQSTEHWQRGFTALENSKNAEGKWEDSPIQRGTTLSEAEAILVDIIKSKYPPDYPSYYQYRSVASITNPQALEALEYVKPFENGIFAYNFYGYLGLYDVSVRYTRYLSNFPTNENITISNQGANYSLARFEPGDWEDLPQLGKALAAVSAEYDAGNIKPPHLKETDAVEFLGYAITGKFIKCDSGVYGLVTVRWNYEPTQYDVGYRLIDECYYLIASGEDSCLQVTGQELVDLFGNYAPEIYRGEYDDLGRIEREYIIYE